MSVSAKIGSGKTKTEATPPVGSQQPFANRGALVTGGGTGIGRSIAMRLAAQGAHVVVCGRRTEPLESTVAEIKKAGGRAFSLPGDVANSKSSERLVEQAASLLETFDMLVNNAGVARVGALENMSTEDIDLLVDVDLKGPIHLTRAALPHLAKAAKVNDSAAILNISSSVTFMALSRYSVYSAAKAGLEMLTRCLALELAEQRIRVNAIAPGVVNTPIFSTMMSAEAAHEHLKGSASFVPWGRVGTPEDVSRLATVLLSPANDWLTGAIVPLDGGLSLGLRT